MTEIPGKATAQEERQFEDILIQLYQRLGGTGAQKLSGELKNVAPAMEERIRKFAYNNRTGFVIVADSAKPNAISVTEKRLAALRQILRGSALNILVGGEDSFGFIYNVEWGRLTNHDKETVFCVHCPYMVYSRDVAAAKALIQDPERIKKLLRYWEDEHGPVITM